MEIVITYFLRLFTFFENIIQTIFLYTQNCYSMIVEKTYLCFWHLFSPIFSNHVVFIIHDPLHYVMVKNILPYIRNKYYLYPTSICAKDYLIKEHIVFSSKIFFPKTIAAADFLHYEDKTQRTYSISFRTLLSIPQLKKIQIYHGLIDKNYTFSKKNKLFDLMLVPGRYAKHRLMLLGIEPNRIKIVGYPKLDSCDTYFHQNIIAEHKSISREPTILYAPTWGLLSSIPFVMRMIIQMKGKYHIVFKPHRYTEWYYVELFKYMGIDISLESDITKLFNHADIMISDISSVMFEFLATGKPCIAIDSSSYLSGVRWLKFQYGPEMVLRDLFVRVKGGDDIEKTVKKALNTYRFTQTAKNNLEEIIEPIYPAGEKAAREIKKFLNKKYI